MMAMCLPNYIYTYIMPCHGVKAFMEKPLKFVGSSRDDLLNFPADARREAGFDPGARAGRADAQGFQAHEGRGCRCL